MYTTNKKNLETLSSDNCISTGGPPYISPKSTFLLLSTNPLTVIAKCWIQALIDKRNDRKSSKILKPTVRNHRFEKPKKSNLVVLKFKSIKNF